MTGVAGWVGCLLTTKMAYIRELRSTTYEEMDGKTPGQAFLPPVKGEDCPGVIMRMNSGKKATAYQFKMMRGAQKNYGRRVATLHRLQAKLAIRQLLLTGIKLELPAGGAGELKTELTDEVRTD